MSEMMEQLRSLQEQGLVERLDLEDTGGDPAEIVKNVLSRLRGEKGEKQEERIEVLEYFLAHPEAPSNLLSGETDPGDRPNYSSRP